MVCRSPPDNIDPKRDRRSARSHTTEPWVVPPWLMLVRRCRCLAGLVTEALAVLRVHGKRDWHGWLIAARLPAVLARLGITATPLPCLTGLARAMRYSAAGAAKIEVLAGPTPWRAGSRRSGPTASAGSMCRGLARSPRGADGAQPGGTGGGRVSRLAGPNSDTTRGGARDYPGGRGEGA